MLVWQQRLAPGWWEVSEGVLCTVGFPSVTAVRVRGGGTSPRPPLAVERQPTSGSSCSPLAACKTHAFFSGMFRYFKGHWDGYF